MACGSIIRPKRRGRAEPATMVDSAQYLLCLRVAVSRDTARASNGMLQARHKRSLQDQSVTRRRW
jgi:hypothetical protein